MVKKYTDEDLIEILQEKEKELGRSPKAKEVKQWATIIKHFGSFNRGLEAAGLTPGKVRDYTEEELIEILQYKAKELGRTPKSNEIKQFQTIVKHFGSFNQGLEAAGLAFNRERSRSNPYTKEELIEILQHKAKKLGRTPTQREVKQAGIIQKHFGSFNKGLEAAGLPTNKKDQTEEELIEYLQEKAKKLGRPPQGNEIKHTSAIINCFGSFNKGLEAAGLTPGRRKKYSKEQLIEILQQKAKEFGRPPMQKEIKQFGAIKRHFGSFNEALKTAGLIPHIEHSRTRTTLYTKEELIEILQQKAKELGRTPKKREIKQSATIRKRFGSFHKGLEAAGLTPNQTRRKTYTEENLIEILRQKAKELGRTPKAKEVGQVGSIVKYFGSYNKGLEAAGLKKRQFEKQCTKEELIAILQQKAKELRRAPKSTEISQRSSIFRHFGSFNAGLQAAGLTPNQTKRKTYTEENLIEILQQKAKELGRTPKAKEITQYKSMLKHFGSFNAGLEAAGLASNQNKRYTNKKYTEEELIAILKQRYKELGRTPKAKEITQYKSILKHFGSFNAGLEAAGLASNQNKRYTNKKYTEEELIAILKQRYKELGRPPHGREVNQASTIKKYFGSFNKGLEAAGLAPNQNKRYTKKELIAILKQRYKELGRTPKAKEITQYKSILKHFGSFNAGLEAAGLASNTTRKWAYTESDLIEILQQKASELGRSPKHREVKQWATIRKHFGSFNKGLEAAGLALNTARNRTYTESDLIEILQKKAKELGRRPKHKEVKQGQTIKNHFGSFNKGLEAAGLALNTARNRIYTESDLINILQQKASELGRPPKHREVKQGPTIRNHFGSYKAGLKAAGLTPDKRGRKTMY
ncbi:homing endonuclease associated repeat-containing protein (plasmid) [Bacillus velezensis]|uniref:homing endonuclease associated repeat-containing protein n=1 Tax=Bacillus velezensis TaxID=492670 RepID=UPI0038D3A529